MKFIHTGDLHIGKVLHECDLLQDQRYILGQIAGLAAREKVDAVVLAGDIYDRSIPTAEAVTVLDEFLTDLIEQGICVLAVSGNHDSPERLSFAGNILKRQGLHLSGVCEKEIRKVTFSDDFGEVAFFLLPFMKPGDMKLYLKEEIKSCDEGVQKIIGRLPIDSAARNVLVTHYFVTDAGSEPELSDSETRVVVGGLDQVEASAFAGFDYTALGHIHKPQQIKERPVYYAGTPLKYSFSETMQEKSVNLVELGKKGEVLVTKVPLKPLREMRILRGELKLLLADADYQGEGTDDFIRAVLTDKDELDDPIGRLRTVYPNVLQVVVERHYRDTDKLKLQEIEKPDKSVLELYSDFYQYVTDEELDEERRQILTEVICDSLGRDCL
ncbi:exonuclease SbcCD subunit D [Diplocloster agilis]|uniref:Nuclease SbcCD subunit D n=1 Tax=Diplocloster agilis TaxID=2850323 RepID=A0A949NFZ1_9FIRM|nr:exonuclease SbcCD subunit D [Diplocloster agilis]MBU9739021.1 exonuclease SbcCD subunit D [Diplocloster agilis]